MTPCPDVQRQALVLVAHGSRDPAWSVPFEQLLTMVRALRPDARVELAYLDYMAPTLPDCLQSLAHCQVARVDVLPLFLGAGGHVRKDVPQVVAHCVAAYPTIHWVLHEQVGAAPSVLAGMADWAVASAASESRPTP